MKRRVLALILVILLVLSGVVYAVLNHVVVDTRQYYSDWLIDYEVTDSVTGKIYNSRINLDHSPSSEEISAFAIIVKNTIRRELDFQTNGLNLLGDEVLLLEYYRNIKRDTVLQIRAFPAATLGQAETYINGQYSDSPLVFGKIYNIWLDMVDLSTWVDFKTWVIDHKFRGID